MARDKDHISFNDIAQVYPKIQKLADDDYRLGHTSIDIEEDPRKDSPYPLNYAVVFGGHFELIRTKLDFSIESSKLILEQIYRRVVKGSAALTVLSLMFWLKMKRLEIDSVMFETITPDGYGFWAKFLGFGKNVNKLERFLTENSTEHSGNTYTIPFSAFEKRVEAEWK